jgi:hypothetical protein
MVFIQQYLTGRQLIDSRILRYEAILLEGMI